jgi:ribosome biogenesis GTP-binding protein YsxC/EngB
VRNKGEETRITKRYALYGALSDDVKSLLGHRGGVKTGTKFTYAATNEASLPEDDVSIPEVAFAGRSNVGKSSLINAVTLSSAARSSDVPGKTQSLNFYDVSRRLRVVDMPGYGFAFANDDRVTDWNRLMDRYLTGRKALKRVYVVIDARHGLKQPDREMLAFLSKYGGVSYAVVLNKTDLVKPADLARRAFLIKEELRAAKRARAEVWMASTSTGAGVAEFGAELLGLAAACAPGEEGKVDRAAASAAAAAAAAAGDDDAAVGDEDADASGFAAGVAPADAVPPPESPQRAKNDVAMTRAAETARKVAASRVEAEQRELAFAEYKKSVSPERAAEAAAASARLKQAKASLKEAVETVNTLKAEIDALGVAVDEAKVQAAAERGADEPAEVVDAETYASMVALKKTKARYRATFEEVKRLKASLPGLTTAAAETRAALVQAFQEWYEKGGGLDLLVQRDADEDDMDYGEKFDQLELQRALNRDPESGAFFAAKKGLLGSTKRVPVTRTVQHMRALASTQRRAF